MASGENITRRDQNVIARREEEKGVSVHILGGLRLDLQGIPRREPRWDCIQQATLQRARTRLLLPARVPRPPRPRCPCLP